MSDTSEIRIDKLDKEQAALLFDERSLALMTSQHSDPVIIKVPGFKYWAMGERCKMSLPVNDCGYQQRAWEFYWTIRCGVTYGQICLGIGTGSVGSPSQITTDKFNSGEMPDPVRYAGGNGDSHMRLDADKTPWPFFDQKFAAVIFNHSFEHLADQAGAIREALRVTKHDGMVGIIQPDMSFNARGSIDPTHITEWSADAFLDWTFPLGDGERQMNAELDWPKYDVYMHNTLDNDFSFDTILQRK